MEIDVLILHGIPWRIFHGNPWNSMEFHTGKLRFKQTEKNPSKARVSGNRCNVKNEKKKLTENTVHVWPKDKKMITSSLKAALGDCFS